MAKKKSTQEYISSFETVSTKYEDFIDVKVVDPTDYNINDYYNRNPQLRRKNVSTSWTPELLREYERCRDDINYFARKYCYVIHPDYGKVKIRPYPYQGKMWDMYNGNRFNITLACRQSGKSIGYVVYLAWKIIFNDDFVIALLANKGATARGILARVKTVIENLPFFLQPGITAWNRTYIEFETQSRILTASTSKSSIRGESINLLVLDEFAFIDNDVEFVTSTMPVISSGTTTQVIIVSTANGIGNQFHKLWTGAVNKTNTYASLQVDWWDVPGRDEAWMRQQIANTSQLQFDQEFGNLFYGSTQTLIDSKVLVNLVPHRTVAKAEHSVKIYELPQPGHQYMMSVDIAEGRGLDYHSWNIIDVTEYPFRQVCTMYDKEISVLYLPELIYNYATKYNKAFLIIETNNGGLSTAMSLNETYEYDNLYFDGFIKAEDVGLKMTKRVRPIGISNLKDIIESGNLQIIDEDTIFELSCFEFIRGKYQAKPGTHDDLVMSLASFSYITQTEWFKNEHGNIGSLQEKMLKEKLLAEENDLLPPPIFDDGLIDLDSGIAQFESFYNGSL